MVRPYLLTGPALVFFGALLAVPLGMTLILSFNDFSTVKGIEPVFILKNWQDLFTDDYFREMFGRTLDFTRDGSQVDRLLDSGLRVLEAELDYYDLLNAASAVRSTERPLVSDE